MQNDNYRKIPIEGISSGSFSIPITRVDWEPTFEGNIIQLEKTYAGAWESRLLLPEEAEKLL
jgi:hypothetical protein